MSLSEKKFFALRGFMKSGTNWVGNLLNLHPNISCVGEFHWQTYLEAYRLSCRNLPALKSSSIQTLLRDELELVFKRCLAAAADDSAKLIGDRTPHTMTPIVLRGCPHVCLIRDGRDVLVSRIFHLYNNPQVHQVFKRFDDMRARFEKFRENPWYFRDHPDELLGNETVVRESMRWWTEHLKADQRTVTENPGLPVLQVRYEDFHADVRSTCRRVFEFLGVAAEESPPIHEHEHLVPGLPEERPNEFNRKGIVGDWENYVTDSARRWIDDEAGVQLRQYGYLE